MQVPGERQNYGIIFAMRFRIFISSVQSGFAKARLAIAVVATSATLPIAAMASQTGAGGGGKGAGVIEPFPDGARVVFFGDSITQNGVAVTWVAAHYRKMFPNGNVRMFNVGISGGSVGADRTERKRRQRMNIFHLHSLIKVCPSCMHSLIKVC